MRSFLLGALAAVALCAGAESRAAADEVAALMAQLNCPAVSDPPRLPSRRASEREWSAASVAYNAWIDQRNAAVTCAAEALTVLEANESSLVEEHAQLNAAGREAQSAWLAAQQLSGGRGQ
jgi:hypothetical protein